MNSQQFNELQADFAYNNSEFARVLGISARKVAEYRRGGFIPHTVALACMALQIAPREALHHARTDNYMIPSDREEKNGLIILFFDVRSFELMSTGRTMVEAVEAMRAGIRSHCAMYDVSESTEFEYLESIAAGEFTRTIETKGGDCYRDGIPIK